MIIVGIDPGTERTGYGIIQTHQNKSFELKHQGHGCITTDRSETKTARLVSLEKQLSHVLKEYRPDALAVETLFFFKNLKTVMPVSEARGVILFTGAKKKIPIYEFSPLQVKMTITGYGRAEKKQVQLMMQDLLHLEELPKPDDAADGLALAATCALALRNKQLSPKEA
jgi:crossover junction endodeoxyribonuclease RuvC